MSTIQEIETAVTQLSPAQLADFRAWFAEYEAQNRDQQIAEDVVAGRLNTLGKEVLAERGDWHQLAAQNLAAAYGEDEPEYTVADLQKPNPAYRAS